MYQLSLMLVFMSLLAAWLALLLGAVLWFVRLVGLPAAGISAAALCGIFFAFVIVREIKMHREEKQ